ncbi:LysR family transcriptional regulator [Novosphingobium olei]|uniref:LysR family transcriptional regulator n=1 Tax=Novosphingobium olei TaxID=2728851 RepID=UPI0030915C66|nr:LysR family transcriptional regulator [Novosphingobium olei]
MTNIKNLDLNLLRGLHALIETRSVTRAAERLGLSQPAVSGILARLRDALGDPLFVRGQHGLMPTPRTLELSGPLARLLTELEALVKPTAFIPHEAQMTFRIAATDYAQTAIVLPLLKALRKAAPGIRLAVRPVGPHFADELAEGRIDVACVTPDMAPDTLRARTLFEEDYICILRPGHPAADQLDLDRFCGLDHAIMSHDGTRFRGATDVALDRIGRSRKVIATVPSFLVLMDIVRGSDTIALVPRRLTAGANGLVLREPPIALKGFTKILTWHERMQHDPAHIWLRDQLVRLAA